MNRKEATKMSNVKCQMSNEKMKGFTLLELLVSISIIGVLVSLAAVSYSSAQKKSRDAKRQGDLKAIQNAMEQYYSQCDYVYPATLPGVGSPLSCDGTEIMEKVPSDPKSGSAYDCVYPTPEYTYSCCANSAEVIPTPCVKNLQ